MKKLFVVLAVAGSLFANAQEKNQSKISSPVSVRKYSGF
jgi:hypothetical protein